MDAEQQGGLRVGREGRAEADSCLRGRQGGAACSSLPLTSACLSSSAPTVSWTTSSLPCCSSPSTCGCSSTGKSDIRQAALHTPFGGAKGRGAAERRPLGRAPSNRAQRLLLPAPWARTPSLETSDEGRGGGSSGSTPAGLPACPPRRGEASAQFRCSEPSAYSFPELDKHHTTSAVKNADEA